MEDMGPSLRCIQASDRAGRSLYRQVGASRFDRRTYDHLGPHGVGMGADPIWNNLRSAENAPWLSMIWKGKWKAK